MMSRKMKNFELFHYMQYSLFWYIPVIKLVAKLQRTVKVQRQKVKIIRSAYDYYKVHTLWWGRTHVHPSWRTFLRKPVHKTVQISCLVNGVRLENIIKVLRVLSLYISRISISSRAFVLVQQYFT